MADNKFNNSQDKQNSNETMQREQARMEVSGDRMSEQKGGSDRQEKSAIGGGQTSGQSKDDRSQTGEPGRAPSELGENRNQTSGQSTNQQTGQKSDFDKNREPAKSTDQR